MTAFTLSVMPTILTLRPPPGQSLWLVSTDSNGVVSSLNEKFTNGQDILVYPNPAREKLTLIMDQGGSASGVISVFNLQGQLIYTSLFEGSELDIDVSAFQPSLYILHVQTEDERYRIRFVKEWNEPSGQYYYKAISGEQVITGKLSIIK